MDRKDPFLGRTVRILSLTKALLTLLPCAGMGKRGKKNIDDIRGREYFWKGKAGAVEAAGISRVDRTGTKPHSGLHLLQWHRMVSRPQNLHYPFSLYIGGTKEYLTGIS